MFKSDRLRFFGIVLEGETSVLYRNKKLIMVGAQSVSIFSQDQRLCWTLMLAQVEEFQSQGKEVLQPHCLPAKIKTEIIVTKIVMETNNQRTPLLEEEKKRYMQTVELQWL